MDTHQLGGVSRIVSSPTDEDKNDMGKANIKDWIERLRKYEGYTLSFEEELIT